MKDYYKNPNFYYIAVPIASAVWLVFTWAMSLPAAEQKWGKERTNYEKADDYISKILPYEPERLEFEKQQGKSGDFDYASAIEVFAKKFKIPSAGYSHQARGEKKRAGRKTKSADVKIDEVNIEKIAQFISGMLYRWPDLQCEQLSLTKLKSGKDAWKANMKFTYYY